MKADIFGRDHVVAAWSTGRIGSRQLCFWALAPFHPPVNVNSLGVWQIRCPGHVWWITCLPVFPAFFVYSLKNQCPNAASWRQRVVCNTKTFLKDGGKRFRELGCYHSPEMNFVLKRELALSSHFSLVWHPLVITSPVFFCCWYFANFIDWTIYSFYRSCRILERVLCLWWPSIS